MKTLLISICIAYISADLFSQEFNIYQQDFIELTEIVHSTYPLNDSVKTKLVEFEPYGISHLNKCNDSDYLQIVSQSYMAILEDGHSKVHCYQPFTRKGHHPVKFEFINNELYIANVLNILPEKYIGKQVIAIESVSIDTICQKAKKIISASNSIDLHNYLVYLLNKPTFLEYLGIEADNKFKLTLKDGTVISWIRDIKAKESYIQDDENIYPVETSDLTYYEATENDLTGWSNKLFEYRILEESNTCYFNFRECVDIQWLNANKKAFKPFRWLTRIFWYFRGGKFTNFTSKMFKDIEKQGIGNLVIDLRNNKGGSSILGYQLLDYLTDIENMRDYSESFMLSKLLKVNHSEYFNEILIDEGLSEDSIPHFVFKDNNSSIEEYLRDTKSYYYQKKPKRKFTGNVYVMVGNKTFSSAAMIATLLSDNNIATVVGNPMAIGASHYGEVLSFTLTNTGVEGLISCKEFYRPDKENRLKELSVDIKITNTERHKYEGVDYEFEELLKIINKDSITVN